MIKKWKKYLCTLFILIALPYVITIFVNGPMRLTSPKQEQRKISVKTASEKKAKTISLDAYGMGILAKEIPMNMEMETIKAQAVLVRTGIYKQMTEDKNKKTETVFQNDFLTVADMEKEWGKQMREYYKKLTAAWNQTKEEIVLYENKPAYTPYCRLTNGKTRDAKEALGTDAYPYLKSVECPDDKKAEDVLQSTYIKESGYEITKTDSTGYVLQVKKGDKTMTGDQFRDQWKLPSSCYTLKNEKKGTRVTTKGIGHGLGLSQNMADRMAKKGKNHKEILEYFFSGTTIQEVAEILNKSE